MGFRDAMRRIASTVTIVTATDHDRHHGMTVTAVTSVSMEPPSLLVCLNNRTRLHDIMGQARRFCVNVLHDEQAEVSVAFSGALPPEERFDKGAWRNAEDGLGFLEDAQANIFCRKVAAIPYGTHTIFVGQVVEVRLGDAVEPLIYQNATYRGFSLVGGNQQLALPASGNRRDKRGDTMAVEQSIGESNVSTYRPSPAALKTAIRAALPAIKQRALATERARCVPEDNIEALRAAGLFKVVQPREFGGYEYDFHVLVDLVVEIGRACASTAWVAGLLAAHQWLLGNMPLQAQQDVWDADANSLLCGSYAPTSKAVAEPGGYRLTGRWSFTSGCENSQWSFLAAMLPGETAGVPPQPAFLLVPASDYAIDDTWDVVGLAGTGSKTVVLADVFVPAHRVLRFSDTVAGRSPGAMIYENRGFNIPMLCLIPSCLAATSVGAAQGALEDYLSHTSSRVTRGAVAGANNRMAEFATIQLRVAEAAASIDAARLILLRDLQNVTHKAREQGTVDIEDRITCRRGQAFAVSLAIRAADALNASTGGNGLELTNSVQRAWRDANAVGRHISLNWDAVGTMYGQMALGLVPKGQY
jgi:alkylation response protein AidB-like acyl-CoA dehydrogenase/flavin reductase (DIM6/NTAB) family NADH-FMN oxidoreductase RutF